MHSQAQLEHQAHDALAALGATIDPGTVSDAVDLYLCKHERSTGQPVDRDAIGAAVATEAIEAATSWLLTLDAPPQAPPAGATPVQP